MVKNNKTAKKLNKRTIKKKRIIKNKRTIKKKRIIKKKGKGKSKEALKERKKIYLHHKLPSDVEHIIEDFVYKEKNMLNKLYDTKETIYNNKLILNEDSISWLKKLNENLTTKTIELITKELDFSLLINIYELLVIIFEEIYTYLNDFTGNLYLAYRKYKTPTFYSSYSQMQSLEIPYKEEYEYFEKLLFNLLITLKNLNFECSINKEEREIIKKWLKNNTKDNIRTSIINNFLKKIINCLKKNIEILKK
tara:strand:+ start:12181 stop:12930 length:750 start_codon:yes stop_codon:yes gene_type:complete